MSTRSTKDFFYNNLSSLSYDEARKQINLLYTMNENRELTHDELVYGVKTSKYYKKFTENALNHAIAAVKRC